MVTVLRTQPRLLLLLAFLVPISVLAKQFDWPEEWLFFNAIAAIIPLAILLSTATERLAEGLGASIGALLSAVFANATELIIGLVALRAGLIDIVKASITGSVMANLLLALGLSMFVGGVGRQQQDFSPAIARVNGGPCSLCPRAVRRARQGSRVPRCSRIKVSHCESLLGGCRCMWRSCSSRARSVSRCCRRPTRWSTG